QVGLAGSLARPEPDAARRAFAVDAARGGLPLEDAVGVLFNAPPRVVFHRVVAAAQRAEVDGAGRAAECCIDGVVDVTPVHRHSAAGETTVRVTGEDESLDFFTGPGVVYLVLIPS